MSSTSVGGQSAPSLTQDQTSGIAISQQTQLPPLTIVELLAICFLSIAFLHFITRHWYRRMQQAAQRAQEAQAAREMTALAVADMERPPVAPTPVKVTVLVVQPDSQMVCAVEDSQPQDVRSNGTPTGSIEMQSAKLAALPAAGAA